MLPSGAAIAPSDAEELQPQQEGVMKEKDSSASGGAGLGEVFAALGSPCVWHWPAAGWHWPAAVWHWPAAVWHWPTVRMALARGGMALAHGGMALAHGEDGTGPRWG
jgi:hypothetical protein